MTSDLGGFDELVHRIYAAALVPERWSHAVAGICAALAGDSALLFTPEHRPGEGGFVFPHNIPQSAMELWAAKSMLEDPFVKAVRERNLMRDGLAIDGASLVPDDVLLETRFYRELWEPIGIRHVGTSVVFDGTDAHKVPTALAVYRGPAAAPFTGGEIDLLRRLASHVSRALGVMFHLRDAQLQIASTLSALDRLPAGVLLLDAQGDVQFANAAAQTLLRKPDPLVVRAGPDGARPCRLALTPRLARVEIELRRAIAGALELSGDSVNSHFSEALLLPDAQGKPGCVMHVAPLARGTTFGSERQEAAVIVFIYDLSAAGTISAERLVQLFDMTPAEARAALQIMQGGTAEVMADRLGVSVHTFKSQLKAAYQKSRTHRQVDLLKLLLSLQHG